MNDIAGNDCAVLRLHRLHLMDIIPLFAAKPRFA